MLPIWMGTTLCLKMFWVLHLFIINLRGNSYECLPTQYELKKKQVNLTSKFNYLVIDVIRDL
jgi:hypothetical protein